HPRTVERSPGGHTRGHPAVIPQNMPAAGGLAAANYTYNAAPRDGTVICLLQNTVPLEPFYANKQAQFDVTKLSWLGTPTTEVAVYLVWHTSKIRTLQNAQTFQMITGGVGAASTPWVLRPGFYPNFGNQGRPANPLPRPNTPLTG